MSIKSYHIKRYPINYIILNDILSIIYNEIPDF